MRNPAMLTSDDCWVRLPGPNPHARLRLFCLPYAGGGASVYRGWSDRLPSSIQVCPVQLPGREDRLTEPYYTRLAPLVDALGKALAPFLDRPFALFGHSMGALISFELARFLHQRQKTPVHLCVSGLGPPQRPKGHPPIHELPESEFLQLIRGFNGTPRQVLENKDLMRMFLPTLRADFAITETYTCKPGVPLPCPLSVFAGLQDAGVPSDEMMGWREHTCAPFTLHLFHGGHFFLNEARVHVLQALSQDLTHVLQ